MVAEGAIVSSLFLNSLRFENFRTFGTFETQIVPSPGLTLLVGMNGLGKSSFFDALEWGLTGDVSRFKDAAPSFDQGRYLTRRGAARDSHAVYLGFNDGSSVFRSTSEQPNPLDVIRILQQPAWTAEIQDLSTYLAFTHFLGQAAGQRFTSRERDQQWASLKGPSGIDRLEEVRGGLRGRATEMAFNRRIRNETSAIQEADRLLAEWRELRNRLSRLLEAASAAGGLASNVFEARLNALVAKMTEIASEFDPGESSGDALAGLRESLERVRSDLNSARLSAHSLAEVVAKYGAETLLADPDAPSLVAARAAELAERQALQQALSAVEAAVARLASATATVSADNQQIVRLESFRVDVREVARLTAELTRFSIEEAQVVESLKLNRANLGALEAEIAAIQGRATVLAGLEATARAATTKADLARKLPTLRARAAASADALRKFDVARTTVLQASLTSERNRLALSMATLNAAIASAKDRASKVTAAVSAIASHLQDHDQDCPVCKSRFEVGQLRLIAAETAKSKDEALSRLEQDLADLSDQLSKANGGIAEAQVTLQSAEAARVASITDATAVSGLEAQLHHPQAKPTDDLAAFALAGEQQATEALAASRAAAAGDEASKAEKTSSRQKLKTDIAELERKLAEIKAQTLVVGTERQSAVERLAAGGMESATADSLTTTLGEERGRCSVSGVELQAATDERRRADEVAAAARTRHLAAQQALQRSASAQATAAETQAALQRTWQQSGLAGTPEAKSVEELISHLQERLAAIDRFEGEVAVLTTALEVSTRNVELSDLVADMEAKGGRGASTDPNIHEGELQSASDAARRALALTEEAHGAVAAFAEKLREEARRFSEQFLTPLNSLIDDFNEALLCTPGESVNLSATYHKDRTKFDLLLRYRDQLDDALTDKGLPPQVVLSEGQLAANGFSILCAASTAYPWSRWRALLMDDPLQHNDIIHTAAFVDLMRNLVEIQQYQLIMSSHDRGEAEFIRRKFDAACIPCSVIALTAPSKQGVRHLPPEHNAAARNFLATQIKQSA